MPLTAPNKLRNGPTLAPTRPYIVVPNLLQYYGTPHANWPIYRAPYMVNEFGGPFPPILGPFHVLLVQAYKNLR